MKFVVTGATKGAIEAVEKAGGVVNLPAPAPSEHEKKTARREVNKTARAELTNNFGNVHGGVLMTMLDGAMTSAALSHTGFTRAAMTIEMSTQFHRPARGTLTAHGRATRAGQGFDARTFEVRARPTAPIEGARPGMTVLVR